MTSEYEVSLNIM